MGCAVKLQQAVDEYLHSRKAQGYRAGTINNDRRRLTKLTQLIGDVDCRKITHKHIDHTMTRLAATNGPGSLGNYHATYTKFFRWCRSRGYMKPDQDPMAERRAPKHVPRPRQIIPVTAFPGLLDAAGARHPRDRAIIALGLYTAARQSEIRTLRIRHLNLDTGELEIFQHKTQTFDVMPVSAELDTEMRVWLTWYTQHAGPLNPDWYLVPARKHMSERKGDRFVSSPDAPLQPASMVNNMHELVNRALGDIGFPLVDEHGRSLREGVHTLRRSSARAIFDTLSARGYDGAARTAQTVLHHASMAQTERYLQIGPDRAARDKLFKGKRMFPTVGDNVVRLREAE
jgi:integrase